MQCKSKSFLLVDACSSSIVYTVKETGNPAIDKKRRQKIAVDPQRRGVQAGGHKHLFEANETLYAAQKASIKGQRG
jgi:urease beta subunit